MVKGNNEQEDIKRELYNKIKEYETQVARCKNKIDEINNIIIHTCITKYGEHQCK